MREDRGCGLRSRSGFCQVLGRLGGAAESDGVQVRVTELTAVESDGDMAEG